MSDQNTTTYKTCTKCKTGFPVSDFNNDKNRKDGKFPHCKSCSRKHGKLQYEKDPAKSKADRQEHYQANKEKYKERATKWASENGEKRKEIRKAYTKRNPELMHEKNKKHRLANPGLYAAHYKMRQTRKRQAMPAWADQKAIERIYVECAEITRATGVKHHVDHYYPLKSDVVCGLHNEYNLRVIPAVENLSKGNSFPI